MPECYLASWTPIDPIEYHQAEYSLHGKNSLTINFGRDDFEFTLRGSQKKNS